MKLEKREITLNECDSLQDLVCFEKMLMGEYVETLSQMERKESRNTLTALFKEVASDFCLTFDLWKKSVSQNER